MRLHTSILLTGCLLVTLVADLGLTIAPNATQPMHSKQLNFDPPDSDQLTVQRLRSDKKPSHRGSGRRTPYQRFDQIEQLG